MKRNIRNLIIILVLVVGLGGAAHYALNRENDNPPLTDREDGDKDIAKEDEDEIKDNGEDKQEDIAGDREDHQEEDEIEAPQSSIEIGKKLPDFTLDTLEGDRVSLRDYEGKIVLLNFWATWCVYCDEEMPDLQRLSKENDDLTVLGVNVEEPEDLVQDYIDDGGYDFEILLDKKGELAMEYLVSGLPASYFIDEDGSFIGVASGMLTYEQMNEILDDIRDGSIER